MKPSINNIITAALFSITLLILGYIIYAFSSQQFEEHKSWVYSVDINDDIVVSASENELILWSNRSCIGRLGGHANTVKTVAFSNDGQQIASGSIDKSIRVWTTADKKVIKTLNAHSEGVNKVEFSKTGNYIISAGYDGKMFVWDWKTNSIIKEFNTKHTDFSINKHDVLAYADSSCYLTLFDLKTMSTVKIVGQYCGLPVFSPQKNIIAVADINKSSFIFIDLETGNVLSELDISNNNSSHKVSSFKFTPDGQFIAAGIWGGDIEIWDWQKKELIRTLKSHSLNLVNDLAFNNKNQLISASGDRSVKIWNWNTGHLKRVLGDGLLQSKLIGLLSVSVLLTLIAGFWAVIKDRKNKLSSNILLLVLSICTFGVGLILYFFKSQLSKYVVPIAWVTTVLSALFLLSLYYSWLAIFTIPVSLLFFHIKLTTTGNNSRIYIPVVMNLVFGGILCSFIVSAGLWK
jgi:WD40 repeat protein